MTVTAGDRVKRSVMQYFSHARVIAPEELRDEIREESPRGLNAGRKDKRNG
jgi:predicted DNA-binding transcriptional regulator YafY